LVGQTRYIFWQTAGPFLVATFALTGIIWLTQALKMLDVLITQGQTLGTFFELSLLALPSAVNTVLPIALFCALLYTLNKLITDSELVVMFSAGVSRWAITVPVLFLTGLVVVVVIALNLYFMPAGMRELRERLFDIRGDIATSLIREGAFTNPVSGLTVYVRSRTPDGGIRGILVHDERNPAEPVTYMAETGELVRSKEGPRLVMYNGNIERVVRNAKANESPVSLLYFDKYTYDLSQYVSTRKTTEYESRERFLGELFNPAGTDLYGQMFRGRLRAEGHDRLVAALYPIMFAMIALAALLPAPFNRRGYTLRIAGAAAVAIVARVIGFGLINAAASQPAFIPLIYLLPLGICCVGSMWIAGTRFDVVRRRFFAWANRLPMIGARG
ncbi:MAG TPA: LPS export ABC transporter permease LptF, partial [Parvibaculum sp.]